MNTLFLSTFKKSAVPTEEEIKNLFKTANFKRVVSGGNNFTLIISDKLGLSILKLLVENVNRFGFFNIKINCIVLNEFFNELSVSEKDVYKQIFNAINSCKFLHYGAENSADTFNCEIDKAETIVFLSPKKSTRNMSSFTHSGKKIRIFYI